MQSSKKNCDSVDLAFGSIIGKTAHNWNGELRPEFSVYFLHCSHTMPRKQAVLAGTVKNYELDLLHASEMYRQAFTSASTFRDPNTATTPWFTLNVFWFLQCLSVVRYPRFKTLQLTVNVIHYCQLGYLRHGKYTGTISDILTSPKISG